MDYKIGQLRKEQFVGEDAYSEEISLIYRENDGVVECGLTTVTTDIANIQVKDTALILENNLKEKQSYYFNFYATSFFGPFVVTLRANDGSEQPLKKFDTTKESKTFCSLVFMPNANSYNKIVFKRINRTEGLEDRVIIDNSTIEKEDIQYTKINLYSLLNVISAALGDGQFIKKMGLQGPPGLIFCVNGEEIHMGKTGIYEVDKINIGNLGLVLDDGDYFIMDYLYDSGKENKNE